MPRAPCVRPSWGLPCKLGPSQNNVRTQHCLGKVHREVSLSKKPLRRKTKGMGPSLLGLPQFFLGKTVCSRPHSAAGCDISEDV